MRPRLLDLFSGAGGAAMGYHRAGFDVVGVDIKPQPNYPFEFVQGDALEFARRHAHEFDVVHASQPCQSYGQARHIHGNGDVHPDLVDMVRDVIEEHTYVIENVPGSPLLRGSVMLCGLMFGLPLYRHRFFESNATIFGMPEHPKHTGRTLSSSAYSSFEAGADVICVAGHNFRREDGEKAMGIDWMTRKELSQAIPPSYTEWIGAKLLAALAACVLLMAFCMPSPARAEEYAVVAEVVDAVTIDLEDQRKLKLLGLVAKDPTDAHPEDGERFLRLAVKGRRIRLTNVRDIGFAAIAASVSVHGVDVNGLMVRHGFARVDHDRPHYSKWVDYELDARRTSRGYWLQPTAIRPEPVEQLPVTVDDSSASLPSICPT